MDGTLCSPGTTQHGLLVPITSVATAPNQDEPAEDLDNGRTDVLWACWCIVLATIHQLQQQIVKLRADAHYWQALHQRAVQREARLKEDKRYLQAQIRELRQRLFGRKSEMSSSTDAKSPTLTPPAGPRRHRGHQVGAPSQGRRNHDHLPTVEERCTLSEGQRCCPQCQQPYEEIPGTAEGSILEVEVRAYRRRYHRQRYRRH